MKNVYLIPGFMASNMGILATGKVLWWDTNFAALTGLGAMRLAANGIDPGFPDGLQMGVDPVGQDPWPEIFTQLKSQLDPAVWSLAVGPYDWRKKVNIAAASLAQSIRDHSTIAEPATIVAHSMGGLVAMTAWARLVLQGGSEKVRRIITLCTPFQGTYQPIMWLAGLDPSIQQLIVLANLNTPPPFPPLGFWTLEFLNKLALSWPAFYQVFPSLIGSEAANDPNRHLLYTAANYAAISRPSQAWLDDVKNFFQPQMADAITKPPSWIATYVYGTGLYTVNRLGSSTNPLKLNSFSATLQGDGTVTAESASRGPGLVVQVTGDHSSVPLALARNGLLAALILDPRREPDPEPPPIVVKRPLPINVTPPPDSNAEDGLVCVGGHC